MDGRAVSFSVKNCGGCWGVGVLGRWGEDFFEMKNSFLLIKILPTSLSPYLPTSPQIKF
jgi:hypothetical protein